MPFVDYISPNDDDNDIIGIWKNEETIEDLLLQLRPTGQTLTAYNQLLLPKRQIEFCINHLLLQELLDMPTIIVKDEYGKPVLPEVPFNISISHTQEYSSVMLSDKHECGIDVESIQSRICTIAPRFTSDYERTYITKPKEATYYTIIWSIKEALYKWYAKGRLDFKQNMIVHPISIMQSGGPVYVEFLKENKRAVHIAQYRIFNNHVIAWVSAPDFIDCAIEVNAM